MSGKYGDIFEDVLSTVLIFKYIQNTDHKRISVYCEKMKKFDGKSEIFRLKFGLRTRPHLPLTPLPPSAGVRFWLTPPPPLARTSFMDAPLLVRIFIRLLPMLID